MVNSGASDFYKPSDAAQERALQEQSRRHLHRRHRQGRRRRRQRVRHGLRHRRLRQRRLSRTSWSPPTAGARSTTTTATARSPTSPTRPASPRRAGPRARCGSTTTTTAGSISSSAASCSSRSTSNVFCGDNKLGKRFYCIPRVFKPTPSLLFHNNGDGTFTEVSAGTDIQRALGKALGVVATDINGDGLMDLFVANDTVQNFLFVNRGKGKWERDRAGGGGRLQRQRHAALGHGRRRRRHQRRRPAGSVRRQRRSGDVLALPQRRQRDRSPTSPTFHGVAQATRLLSGWGLKFFDYDNDGTGRSDPRQRPSRRHDRELLAAGALQGAAGAVPATTGRS